MPTPLDKFVSPADFTFKLDAMTARPELCAQVVKTMSAFSMLDATIGSVFARMLGAESEKGAAIYSSMVSSNTQDAAFNAVITVDMPIEHRELLQAVREITKAARKQRNTLAHGIFGTAEALPEALLVVKPRAITSFMERMERLMDEILAGKHKTAPDLSVQPLAPEVDVYRLADFIQIQDQIARARMAWHDFRIATLGGWADIPPTPQEALQKLYANPEVLAKVNRLRKERGSELISAR